ncbi:MAG: GNAT family N-acetyltransferase [Oligoflexia bacterium]|nr:GNAT family N-acetyltransferase [Oligoflexia bacterium]
MSKDRPFVRKAKIGDERGIHDAHMRSIQELCSKDYNEEQIGAWGGREFRLESRRNMIENHHVWVVEYQNEIHGYGLLFIGKEKAEIGGLYFTPEVTGNGLGKEIVDAMKVQAKALGFKEIYFESTYTSRKFYEKQGAIQYAPDEASPINGVPIPAHPMKIVLAD